MAKCKVCGKEVEGNFCSNCGTKVGSVTPPNPFQGTGISFEIKDFEKIIQQTNDATKDFEITGDMQKDLNKMMENVMGGIAPMLGSIFGGDANIFGTMSMQQKPNPSKKAESVIDVKEARLSILNNMCPKCGTDFKDDILVCPKCKTSLNINDYR